MQNFVECCVVYVEDYMKIVHVATTNIKDFDGGVFHRISRVAADEAIDALEEGKVVLVHRNVGEVIEFSDILITDGENELQMVKDGTCFRARMHINNKMAMLRAFDFFEFTICNNKLASHGIFIHDGNREEKYIEIINSGDEKLIECLEVYLNSWDTVSDVYTYYKKFLEFERNVQSAGSIEAVKELADNYHYLV